MKNKEAVSPVIGTVLLLGITVVFASMMFLWVSSITLQTSSGPVGTLAVDRKADSMFVNYTITLTAFRPKTDPKDVVCYFYENDILRGNFDFPETPESHIPINVIVNGDGKSGTANWTNDDNNRVSSYDIIKISIGDMGNENDRKTLSTYSFALRYEPNGALIAEEILQ